VSDASAPDAFVEAADAPPALDTGAAPTCPSPQTGGYTFEGAIPDTCPPGEGTNTFSVDVAFTPDTCGVSFTSTGDSGWRLNVSGSDTLSSTGTLGPATFSLNGMDATCTATYEDGSPQRFVFDCGDCDFTIRFGE
jgi:hypothetical protein